MLSFLRPVPIGLLVETSDDVDVLWRGPKEPLPNDLLLQHTSNLPVAGRRLITRERAIIERGFKHTIGWAESYIRVEKELLDSDFISDEHLYEILVFKSNKCSEIDVSFRLSTRGHPGWTAYAIGWRRIEADLFLCAES